MAMEEPDMVVLEVAVEHTASAAVAVLEVDTLEALVVIM